MKFTLDELISELQKLKDKGVPGDTRIDIEPGSGEVVAIEYDPPHAVGRKGDVKVAGAIYFCIG